MTFVHSLGFAACLSKNFTSEASYLPITSYNYFRLRNLSTNIRQTVRKCYKMKSDSRVLLSVFLCFVCRWKPFLSSILPLLPCQCTPLTLQQYPFCIPIVLHLKRKSTVNGVQLYSFCCKIESFQRNGFMRIETDSYVTCCVLTL